MTNLRKNKNLNLFENNQDMIIVRNIRLVYANKMYLVISFLVSLITFVTLYYLTFYYTTPKVLRSMEGPFYLYFTFISNIIISILFGFNVSMLIQKLTMRTKIAKEGSLSGSGALVAAFASGCPVCGSLLLPLIGISSGLAAFPFRGLELKALALSLILVSTYFVLRNSNKCELCENGEIKK